MTASHIKLTHTPICKRIYNMGNLFRPFLALMLGIALLPGLWGQEIPKLVALSNYETVMIGQTIEVGLQFTGELTDTVDFHTLYNPQERAYLIDPVPDFSIEPSNSSEPWNSSCSITGRDAGHVTVYWNATSENGEEIDLDSAFIVVTIVHSKALSVLCDVVGWIYFVGWSLSFWPQAIQNYQRKSVVGLNFDYVALNFFGHALYGAFNYALYWNSGIQAEYFKSHLFGVIPVRLNDAVFSIHATFICFVLVVQCFIYERGGQKMTIWGILFVVLSSIFLVASSIAAACDALTWLQVVYYCSYVKLLTTMIKYAPQAYMNYKRKSTEGWSIGNVLLDFMGGTCSILQMFLLSYNNDDWSSIFGDPTKFGLGLFSVMYDVLFIVQHYVLYRHAPVEPTLPANPYGSQNPIIA